MPLISINESLSLSDSVSLMPSPHESLLLSDVVIVIKPVIQLPPEVVDALRHHPSQRLYQYMQTASIEIQKIRRVDYGYYVLAEDINQPRNAALAMIDYLLEATRLDPSTVASKVNELLFDARFSAINVPDAKAGDIYDSEWHNNIVDALWRILDSVRAYYPTSLPRSTKNLLAKRARGDTILPDDHNYKKTVLESTYNVSTDVRGVIVVLMESTG